MRKLRPLGDEIPLFEEKKGTNSQDTYWLGVGYTSTHAHTKPYRH